MNPVKIDVNKIYCRFWKGQLISEFACPLSTMPHVEMVRRVLSGQDDCPRYDKFVRYSTSHYEQSEAERHSSERFRTNILLWKHAFDDIRYPIKIAKRNGVCFITNGVHRASFALATSRWNIAVECGDDDIDWKWPQNVEIVECLESVLPESEWISASTKQ